MQVIKPMILTLIRVHVISEHIFFLHIVFHSEVRIRIYKFAQINYFPPEKTFEAEEYKVNKMTNNSSNKNSLKQHSETNNVLYYLDFFILKMTNKSDFGDRNMCSDPNIVKNNFHFHIAIIPTPLLTNCLPLSIILVLCMLAVRQQSSSITM